MLLIVGHHLVKKQPLYLFSQVLNYDCKDLINVDHGIKTHSQDVAKLDEIIDFFYP